MVMDTSDGGRQPINVRVDGRIDPTHLIGFRPFSPLQHVPWHIHDFFELAFVTQGSARHLTSAGELKVEPGAVVFVPPSAGHGLRLCRDLVMYQCFLRASAAELSAMWVAKDPRLEGLIGPRHRETASPLVLRIGTAAVAECIEHLDEVRLKGIAERTPAAEVGRLLIVLDILARHLPVDASTIDAAGSTPPIVGQVLQLFDHDLAYPWTLLEIGRRVGVRSDHLCRAFRRWAGVPPMAFLNQRRIDVAAGMLASTSLPISQVASAVGVPSPTSFSRAFRRARGQSPREYRSQRLIG